MGGRKESGIGPDGFLLVDLVELYPPIYDSARIGVACCWTSTGLFGKRYEWPGPGPSSLFCYESAHATPFQLQETRGDHTGAYIASHSSCSP
jgi:hypothetical protein